MKSLSHLILNAVILTMLVACGKDNKSGKTGSYDINPYTGLPNVTSSPYTLPSGQNVTQVLNENPCLSGFNGTGNYRTQVSINLTGFPSYVPANDFYVGVTSYGDVAVIVGTGSTPVFVAYLCPRSSMSGQGQLTGINIGSYTSCAFKPIPAATMVFPDGTSANFRDMKYGSSRQMKFSYCQ